MGVTFWSNFAARTLLVPFHWRGMCYAIGSAGKSRCACEKLKKRRQILGRPSQAQFLPQLRDGGLLMTPGQHRGGSAAYEAGRPGGAWTKRSPSAGAVGKIARLPTEAFHVDSRYPLATGGPFGSTTQAFGVNDAWSDRSESRRHQPISPIWPCSNCRETWPWLRRVSTRGRSSSRRALSRSR
jgi:hypothetical protein